MAENDDEQKKVLHLSGSGKGKLELKKPTTTSSRQSFSHGRSKSVGAGHEREKLNKAPELYPSIVYTTSYTNSGIGNSLITPINGDFIESKPGFDEKLATRERLYSCLYSATPPSLKSIEKRKTCPLCSVFSSAPQEQGKATI